MNVIDLLLVAFLALVLGLSMAAALRLARLSVRSGPTVQATQPVGPAFSSVTQVFALILALHASTLWVRYEDGQAATARLNYSIDSLQHFASVDLPAPAPAVVAAIARYETLLRDQDAVASVPPEVARRMDAALWELRTEAARTGANMPAPLHASLMQSVDEVARSHAARMHERAARPNVKLWFVIFALCFLSQVIIALVHQDKPAAASRVLLLFNLAVGAIFWLGLRYEFHAPLEAMLQ